MDWTACPVCGLRATIYQGQYISLLSGLVIPPELVGTEEKYSWFMRDPDWIEFPCGGYIVQVGQAPRHINEGPPVD